MIPDNPHLASLKCQKVLFHKNIYLSYDQKPSSFTKVFPVRNGIYHAAKDVQEDGILHKKKEKKKMQNKVYKLENVQMQGWSTKLKVAWSTR